MTAAVPHVMILLGCLSANALASPPAEWSASAQLEELRRQFSNHSRAETLAALHEFVERVGAIEAAADALNWMGDLHRQAREEALAKNAFERAYRMPLGGRVHALAARGLGDVAINERDYSLAIVRYGEARRVAGLSPILLEELRQKIVLSQRLRTRARIERVAWLAIVSIFFIFVWRARPWQSPGLPTELLYALPVLALFNLGGWGQESNVRFALALGSGFALVLIATSGLAARRAPLPRALHALLLFCSSSALFYVVLCRADLMDKFLMTFGLVGAT